LTCGSSRCLCGSRRRKYLLDAGHCLSQIEQRDKEADDDENAGNRARSYWEKTQFSVDAPEFTV
jgi:hypothetical protein